MGFSGRGFQPLSAAASKHIFILIYSHLFSLGAWFSAPSSNYSYEIWPVLAADIKETEKIIKENDENI